MSWDPYHQSNFNLQKYTLLEQHPNIASQTLLEFADHCHMEYHRQKPLSKNNIWLKELVKIISEAKWEINSIHNPLALKKPGHNKVRKLPRDHLLQTPQAPRGITSTLPKSAQDCT
jgi:hypothetical protein